jgi:hypothetical protein
MTDDTDRLIGLVALFGLGLWIATAWEARMDGSLWKNVRCQRCGALPIDEAKRTATANCPKCLGSEFGEHAPDYTAFTDRDRRFLRSLKIAV